MSKDSSRAQTCYSSTCDASQVLIICVQVKLLKNIHDMVSLKFQGEYMVPILIEHPRHLLVSLESSGCCGQAHTPPECCRTATPCLLPPTVHLTYVDRSPPRSRA